MANSGSGLATFGRVVAASAVALLILVSGGWSSWRTAQYLVLTKGREQGTVTLATCGDSSCTGPFAPKGSAVARPSVEVDLPVRHRVGQKVDVVLKPDSDTGIRSGTGGLIFAFLPLAGALLLAALVVALGLRLPQVAGGLAVAGGVLMAGAFFTLP
ncbi:hypothetical protein [Actinacidiphila guanduensis]|jgi:hypothetical protein|uniref:Uncharacterized protein n=1 Tax=Actinacidiphila guanduensis TaxID=310781 RepID=A0A1H0EZQ3_9ACTN|nr:hypothetical protein [Actinacidiphila guanduensis]SDN87821.1 hypothetical protein SAMN05216259_10696 [Actinacidiphila guanduensis]